MARTLKIFFLFVSVAAAMFPGCSNQSINPLQELSNAPVWPPAPDKPRIKYLYSISKPADIGCKPSLFEKTVAFFAGPRTDQQIVKPHGIFFSKDRILYVADTGLRVVHIFNLQDRVYRKIAAFKKTDLISPIGVAADDKNNLYVSDSIRKKIFVFTPDNKPVMEIGENYPLQRPSGIAVNSSLKRLYVTDTTSHSIICFNLNGEFLFRFGQRGKAEGTFNFPTAITLDRQGNLYINDSLNFRVQIFDQDGKYLSHFGKHGDGVGEFSLPKGVALDSQNNIYVADSIFDTIQIFDTKGTLLLVLGQTGHDPGDFWLPASVFIDGQDRIFISDSFNQRIQVFKFLGGNQL